MKSSFEKAGGEITASSSNVCAHVWPLVTSVSTKGSQFLSRRRPLPPASCLKTPRIHASNGAVNLRQTVAIEAVRMTHFPPESDVVPNPKMLKFPGLFAKAKREGWSGNELHLMREDVQYRRAFMEDILRVRAGKELRHWSSRTTEESRGTRKVPPPLPELELKVYPFSDQKATCDTFAKYILGWVSWSAIMNRLRGAWSFPRFGVARMLRQKGVTRFQCVAMAFIVLLFEIMIPIFWLLYLLFAMLVRVFLATGARFPLLSFIYFVLSGSGINGNEALPPGENGYTKVFQGGDDVDLDELEKALMTRNKGPTQDEHCDVNTICISYKHYANKGSIAGDDHRICRTDLKAVAKLIKACDSCKVRLWIDSKLPVTDDVTFERWLNRGVRPYGRYITFLCPSAQQFAGESFWLSNEYHFAAAAKGAMYIKEDIVWFEMRYGYQLDLYKRFLHVVVGAERQPVMVREEDKGKVIEWGMCCLRAEERGFTAALSPNIDNLTMRGEFPDDQMLLSNIGRVIRKYGELELPIRSTGSWNAANPLLVNGINVSFDLSNWYGLWSQGAQNRIWFVHATLPLRLKFETAVVLEVVLDRAWFERGRSVRIVRKVLKEVDSAVLERCRFVTLPWLVDWT